MTRLYLLLALPFLLGGVIILSIAGSLRRAARRRRQRARAMTIALYFIGAAWTAGGIMLLILGVLGIK